MIEFTHPLFLWLAVGVLPVLIWGLNRSLAGMTRLQKKVCAAVRFLLLSLLILALAGFTVRWRSEELAVVYVLDQSASLSAEAKNQAKTFIEKSLAHQHSGDTAAVVGFAKKAELLLPPTENLRSLPASGSDSQGGRLPGKSVPPIDSPPTQPLLRSVPLEKKPDSATDIGGALKFSSALFPQEKAQRIVLLSDGNDTESRAGQVAQELAQRGIEVFTVPLCNPHQPEVLVERVEAPRRLKAGEPFDLKARIESNTATTVTLRLYENKFLLTQRELALKPGSNELTLPNLRPADRQFLTYDLEIVPPPEADTVVENNRAETTASLRGQPHVLLIDSDETKLRPMAEALRNEKITVETRGPLGAPGTLEDLQQYDLLVLSDLSALALNRDQMELYRRWVQDFGGGFLMLGGENSYGVGGYFRTPIEQMLPVRMEHEDRRDIPSLALLVVLDRSGSMSAIAQGQTKISLANQGAVMAFKVLQPKDFFGVLAVDVRSHVVAPLQQHLAKGPVEQKILSVTAGGGGIYIYTSLAECFQLLRDTPAKIKHVILFSDAADAEEKAAGEMSDGTRTGGSALDLASAMFSAKITTSVVGLGVETDKDTAFLRQLAERGNGRFYLTSDATTLPQIFSTETMKVAQSSLIEEPFQAVPAAKSPLVAGVDWAQAPLLLGYNATKPKPTADVLLATERGEPLLATWRYGLGQAAAFTSDAKSRWASEWLQWPGYGQFWTQVVRGLMRKSDQASFAVQTTETQDQLTLQIDAVKPDGRFRNRLPMELSALGPDGAQRMFTPGQVAPGQYSVTLDLAPEGTTLFSLSSPDLPDGGTVFGHTRGYPREFLSHTLNEPLLRRVAQIGHGEFDPVPESVFQRNHGRRNTGGTGAAQRQGRRNLSDVFLTGALALFPLDLWLRRRTWKSASTHPKA